MAINNEKLEKKYKKATDVLKTLQEAIDDLKTVADITQCAHQPAEKVYRTYRDSMIQRFEYSFDTTWKYLSEYLQSEGRILEIKNPKAVFRESLKAKIISEAQVRLSLTMVNQRNLTTHGYAEELVEEISKNIPNYANLLSYILNQTALEKHYEDKQ